MGKNRQSANLVSDNNIFVNTITDTVGIGTTNPRFTLEVGRVGASGTTLYVNGNARVTGILSIGQGTVSINGDINQINVGTGISINGNSNQINVGTGITINAINGIQVGQNNFNPSGITLNSLNVTGVVTATGGMSIGIQSGGVNVTTGVVTAFNFVGSGNSISYNAGNKTVNISIAGGGGSATRPTKYSEIFVGNDSGFNAAYYYATIGRTAGGTKGNTFYIARLEGSSTVTRCRVYPITVDRTTGVITSGTPVNAWNNTSIGQNYSTTYFMGPDGTGAIFAGGNNAIPGQTTYVFSYFKFIVNANGTLTDSAQVNSSADHITNGTYMTLPTAINTGYIPSIGYQQSTSRAHYRLNTVSASAITVGAVTDLGSDTSTVYAAQMYSQPGVYQTANQAVGFISYRTNASTYYIRAFSASGAMYDYAVGAFDNLMMGFQMSTGDVILYCNSLGRILRFTAFNTVIDITSTAISNFTPSTPSGSYAYPHFCSATNEFVFSLGNLYPFAFNSPLAKATLNSSTGFTVTALTSPDAFTSAGYSDQITSLFPLYANANDATPDKLLLFVQSPSSTYFKAKVISMPTFTPLV